MTTYNQNKNEYCVGDYIGYTVESYNCSIGGYDYHTSYGCIVDYINKNDNVLNINAWNEWNEQAVLEPNDVTGYDNLKTISNVISHI